MKLRYLGLTTMLALVVPFAAPASAAPSCFVLNWDHGDTCWFEAPAGAFIFGGVATGGGEQGPAWIAVEVVFNGVVIDSCYGYDNGTGTATCEGTGQAFAPSFTHVCRVSGTGGPKFHCADPPALPLPIR